MKTNWTKHKTKWNSYEQTLETHRKTLKKHRKQTSRGSQNLHTPDVVSSNPYETGVKRMLSTRSSVLREPKLSKTYMFHEKKHILQKENSKTEFSHWKLNFQMKKKYLKKKRRRPMLAHRSAQKWKKTPPEANASTQKRSKSKKKSREANASTQKHSKVKEKPP